MHVNDWRTSSYDQELGQATAGISFSRLSPTIVILTDAAPQPLCRLIRCILKHMVLLDT